MAIPTQKKLDDCMHVIERLRGGAAKRIPWDQLVTTFRSLMDDFPIIAHRFSPDVVLQRARWFEKDSRPAVVSELGPPSVEQCKGFGRCNTAGQPWAYLGVGRDLTFSEIGAGIGDHVGTLLLSPREELIVARVGALDLFRRTDGVCMLPESVKKQIREIPDDGEHIWMHVLDSFMADFFSRSGSPLVYKVTSALAAALIEDEPLADGLLFDSVDHRKGLCVALKASSFKKLRPIGARFSAITNDLGDGIFSVNELSFTEKLSDDPNPRILWP